MFEFIIEFIGELFLEIFLETSIGIPFIKFIDLIRNKVKSKPLRIIIYILSSILCIGIIFALIAGIIYGILILISINSK